MNVRMARWIVTAAVAGFLVGLFWIAMGFVFFSAEGSGPWWAVYILALLVTCPGWFAGIVFAPIANAAVYALIGLLAFKLRESGRPSRSPTGPSTENDPSQVGGIDVK